jgi:hypothetical protein
MAIDWEKGEVNLSPHQLHTEQIQPTIQEMRFGSAAYVDENVLRAGPENILWVDPAGLIVESDENMDDTWIRLIRVEEGYIVDASLCSISREDGNAITPNYDTDFKEKGWQQVVGFVENDEQRQELVRIVYERYHTIIEPSMFPYPSPYGSNE